MSGFLDSWQKMPVQRRKRVLVLLLATAFVVAVLWGARGVLGPYIVGLVLAYLLAPLVKVFERGWRWVGERNRRLKFFARIARPLAMAFTYLLVIAALVGFSALIVPMIVEQGEALWAERESVWEYLSRVGDDVIAQYRLLPVQIQTQIEDTLADFAQQLGQIVRQAVEGTAVAISYTLTLVAAILIIPFWTFYLLLDAEELRDTAVRTIPSPIREDILCIARLVDSALGAYLRGQLFLGLIIGVVSTIVFTLMGVRFAIFLGLIAGLFELIPNIGPTLGAIPAILVALTQEPILALWVTIYAAGVQQVENIFITPRVVGRSVQLHPVVVMVVLVVGGEILGLAGLFLAPVTTAILRDFFRYIYYRVGDIPLTPENALQTVWKGDPTFSLNI